MCFNEQFSFFNFSLLSMYGGFLNYYSNENDIWRLYIPLYYLSLKDLIQTFLYMFNNNDSYKYILSILSYAHICFQPLVTNMVFSYFSKSTTYLNINYWNMVFIITFLFGLYKLTDLDFFDILKDKKYCDDKTSDYCNDKNSSYIGKYHVGYKFRSKNKYSWSFLFFMIIPALFTSSYILSLIFAFFIYILKIIFTDVRDGELGAIWCLLSIIPTLPIVYYRQFISRFLQI